MRFIFIRLCNPHANHSILLTHISPPFSSDVSGNVEERVFDYPLPCPPPSVPASGGFNYPNSNGFQFEAMALQVLNHIIDRHTKK